MNSAALYLLTGLGNPGAKYQHDRHNVGFMVGEELRRRYGLPEPRSRFQGLISEGAISGHRSVMLWPMTFMNLSGKSVGETARYFKVPLDRMLIIHDEVELVFGDVRLKEGGGLGGHNGLRSIEQHVGSRDFWRLRVGVGRPASDRKPLADHVLEPFNEPREEVLLMIGRAADLAEEWLAAQDGDACQS